jgi:hypothetical protein
LAFGAVGVLTFLMLAGSGIAWNRQEPFMTEGEVQAITAANRYIADRPPGGVSLFVVNGEGPELSFLATRAANVIRAGVPPSRIRDAFVYVPPPAPGAEASATRRALTRLTKRDLMRAGFDGPMRPLDLAFVVKAFDPVDYADPEAFRPKAEIGPGVKRIHPTGAFARPADAVDPLEPVSAWGLVWASIATLALLSVVGFGWARIGLEDPVRAASISPAVGAAALILVAVGLDALGVSLGSTGGAIAASVLAGGGGYLVGFVLQRRARTHPAPQVEQEPAE